MKQKNCVIAYYYLYIYLDLCIQLLACKKQTEEIMSVQLLDKTRKINKLLHNNNSSKVVFNDICAVLTEILDSNVLVVSRKGKILGVSKSRMFRKSVN